MTKIEWTDRTWNPIIGCSKCSPGCDNCYAEKMAGRLSNMPHTHEKYKEVVRWGQHLTTDMYYGLQQWNGQTFFDEKEIIKPYKWSKPCNIFVCSMGDLFHESVSFDDIRKVMGVIHDKPTHTFQILTKRPERMAEFFNWLNNSSIPVNFPNMWLGVTAENQEQADKRMPILLNIPAAKHFVSIEPMLSHLDLAQASACAKFLLDWVICGGETGHKARPMHPDWVRSLRNQCEAANVPFFFKGWGEWCGSNVETNISHDKFLNLKKHTFGTGWFSTDVHKVGKKASGDLLAGKQYHNRPNK